jgi:hypothetical protein
MTWSQITLGKFREIQDIISDESTDELTKKVYLYSLLSGKKIEDVRELPLGEFLAAYGKELEFLSEPIPQVIPQYWEHEGIKYKVTAEISELTAGQYIDFKEYSKEKDNIHKVMAVLCYDGKYDGSKHEERSKLFNENMPITIAAPLTTFFLDLWKEWSRISLAYSIKILGGSKTEWQSTVG